MYSLEVSERKRLWVVDPSINEAEDQCVEQVLAGWSGESRVFQPSLRPGDGPSPGDGYDADGVVVLGSGASVYDDHAWLHELSAWLEPLVSGSRRVPLLGVCFGHQLVGHLAGARVGFLHPDHQKELGTVETRVTGSRVLPGDHSLKVVVSHREIVESTPHGYRVVASRPGVPLDGFEHEDLPILTVQFHPEARDEFAGRRGLDPAVIDARLVEDSNRILSAFRDWVLDGD